MQKKLLEGLFVTAGEKTGFNPSHISIYVALLYCWNDNRQQNPVTISRRKIMKLSKIKSIVTYHKCMRELVAAGLIGYKASYNKFKATEVSLREMPLKEFS